MGRKVQMLANISGYRGNGQPWPQFGEPLVVDDWEAEHLIRGDMARYWPYEDEPAPQQPAPQEPAPAAGGGYGYGAATVQHHHGYAPPAEAPASAPKPVAPKADWVAWAVANGADEYEAAASTKADLMEQYGDRT